MDHILRAARVACDEQLMTILDKIFQTPEATAPWRDLVAFGHAILEKPSRGGKRVNIVTLVKKRISLFETGK